MFPSVRCTSEIALTALRSAVCIHSAVGSKQLNIGARKVSRNWGREEQAKRVPGHVGGVLYNDVRLHWDLRSQTKKSTGGPEFQDSEAKVLWQEVCVRRAKSLRQALARAKPPSLPSKSTHRTRICPVESIQINVVRRQCPDIRNKEPK